MSNAATNNFNPVAKTFSFRIENKYDVAKQLALFGGSIDTDALAKDAEGNLIFTHADPKPINNYCHTGIDAVLTDGILPVRNELGELALPNEKEGKFLRATPLNPRFRIEDLKKYLRSDYYLINRIIIKVLAQDQFDNPIVLQTSDPTIDNGSKSILPTNYSDPTMLQTTKIIIDDIPGTVLQGDTMMFWQINSGEVINMTMEFSESQR